MNLVNYTPGLLKSGAPVQEVMANCLWADGGDVPKSLLEQDIRHVLYQEKLKRDRVQRRLTKEAEKQEAFKRRTLELRKELRNQLKSRLLHIVPLDR